VLEELVAATNASTTSWALPATERFNRRSRSVAPASAVRRRCAELEVLAAIRREKAINTAMVASAPHGAPLEAHLRSAAARTVARRELLSSVSGAELAELPSSTMRAGRQRSADAARRQQIDASRVVLVATTAARCETCLPRAARSRYVVALARHESSTVDELDEIVDDSGSRRRLGGGDRMRRVVDTWRVATSPCPAATRDYCRGDAQDEQDQAY
jgi:hypothetical protein